MFEISDNTVRRYDQKILESDMPAADLDNLRAILIDEKAVRKVHTYVTVVINADTGELLYMAEGRNDLSPVYGPRGVRGFELFYHR